MKKVSQGTAVVIVAMLCSLLTFMTIEMGRNLYGWEFGLFLEVGFIVVGMFFIWEFHYVLKHKLHL